MKTVERRFGAFVPLLGRRSCAYVALFGLLLAHAAHAADAAHARLHHSAQSAGVTEARGKLREISSARRHEARGRRVAEAQRNPYALRETRRVTGRKQKADREAKPVRSRRELETEARLQHTSRVAASHRRTRALLGQATHRLPAGTTQSASASPGTPPAAKKNLSVEDFVRAANGVKAETASSADASSQGVSHPDPDERFETDEIVENTPKTRPSPPQRPVAQISKTPDAQRAAIDQHVVMSLPLRKDTIAAAGVPFADAPTSANVPSQHVVQGFGSEVDVTPASQNARNDAPRKTTAIADLGASDRALQREMTDDALKPEVVPLYTRSGKLLMPPPLKGTHEILVHQNLMANQEGLTRIADDADLNRMRAAHLLMPLPDIAALDINEELPYNRRYARPWAVRFVGDIARAYYAKFGEPLRLNSAVRTVDFQLRLQRVNGNAAAVEGDTASPHLTGQAIDFGKSGMSRAEIAWMRAYLIPIMNAGKIDVEEEFQQACFHISVYESYMPRRHMAQQDVADIRSGNE